ncbi:putative non-ribosomal peptide synthetase [Alloactinosynnema sp. L-07]|uniref:non-ribosomal peptide synthetase n=1 Tax=Alloactinosynnema sp. L-07 TaxID=1653480 RepID=UPI00065EF284|nr:non-ribosomal peptide synthetase [Alloactinosynnema sp. L-07]CRK56700.1 putative non-ribosomal peptide synthetase [Alloactinosynnema sp. L-07]
MTADKGLLPASLRDTTVPALFADVARRLPGREAVVSGATSLTYADLDRRSALLAAAIRGAGVGRGDVVALLVRDRLDWIVGQLAVLRAGAAYLPISSREPAARLRFLLDDSAARLLIGAPDEPTGTPTLGFDATAEPGPDTETAADDPAYVMYTSGSTGTPKGVVVCHRNIVRLVRGNDFVAFGPDLRVLQTGAVGFDATTFEVWGPLLHGGAIALTAEDDVLDPGRLGARLREHAVTTLWLTSPLFSRIALADPAVFGPLRDLVVGGDVVVGAHVAMVHAACPGLRVINGYGPTENTTFSTTHLITPADTAGPVPIGTPLAGSTAYILDADGALANHGELHVGGDGVTLGYLNRPDLTERAFPPDPFLPGGRMYRTGDIVSRRADGVLEFVGRADRQVKVRGYRIEPGEIETVLRAHPEVTDAHVVTMDRPEGAFLVAYAVTAAPAADVRAHLAAKLPRHLVPGYVVPVRRFPLTANGKIDRAELPDPLTAFDSPTEHVPPVTEVEHAVVDLVEAALGVAPVGLLDSIYDLGVDSLTAAGLAASIRARLGRDVTTADVLVAATVSGIAEAVTEAAAAEAVEVVDTPVERPDAVLPLAPGQRALFAAQTRDPRTVRYNVPVRLDLPAGVDLAVLARAWQAVVDRHDALRTSFELADEPVQRVHAQVRAPLAVIDDDRAPVEPFDLGTAPLVRATVCAKRTLWLDAHHIVVDGLSLRTIVADLDAQCRGITQAPPSQFTDHLSRPPVATGHWAEVFAAPLDTADLPYDRPDDGTAAGQVLTVCLGAERTAALRALAAELGTTLFAVLAAAYGVFLRAATGAPEVVFGVPAAGRDPRTATAVGMFVNTVFLRVRPDPAASFADVVADVAGQTALALAHQGSAAAQVPLSALFALQPESALTAEFLGAATTLRPEHPGEAMVDINTQVYEQDRDLRVDWEYRTRFDQATVAAFADLYRDVLDRARSAPRAPTGALTATAPQAPASAPDFDFDL